MTKFKVKFFQTKRGNYPVKEFIERQSLPTYTKILRSIELIENNGPFLQPPYAKKVRPNLYELRIPGKEAIRIFYAPVGGVYYLLSAFKKKSQKLPKKEIQLALDRLAELV